MGFRYLSLLFIFIIPLSLYSQVKDGVTDFSNNEISNSINIKLDGEWEFYWHEFIKPNNVYKNKEYLNVPGTWTKNDLHPAWGYGSYRNTIKGLEKDQIYSLYIPDMATNYKLYIDGILYSDNGEIGTSPKDSKPEFKPKSISFKPKSLETEIVIHVSNYNYRKGGIWRSILLGTDSGIRNYQSKLLIIDVMAISVLLTVALFHLGIFVLRRKEVTELLFSIICFTLAFRALTTGEQIITMFYGNFSWELLRKLEYSPFFLTIPAFVMFIKYLFPLDYNSLYNKIIYIYSFILGLLVLLLPIKISNITIPFAQISIIILIVYVVTIIVKALKNRRNYSMLFSIMFGVFFIAAVNDILYAHFIVFTGYLAPLGFISAIIGQSLILTIKFIHSINKNEILEISRDKFKEESITDALTGLYNSRYLYNVMDMEVIKHNKNNLPLTFLMADVDNFKNFNDTYGHTNGDMVLKKIAQTIKNSARDIDIACRYGGEEFSLILPNTNLEIGRDVAERIRKNFEKIEYDNKIFNGVTISIGVSALRDSDSVRSFIDRADTALYDAKELGKNRVEIEKEVDYKYIKKIN